MFLAFLAWLALRSCLPWILFILVTCRAGQKNDWLLVARRLSPIRTLLFLSLLFILYSLSRGKLLCFSTLWRWRGLEGGGSMDIVSIKDKDVRDQDKDQDKDKDKKQCKYGGEEGAVGKSGVENTLPYHMWQRQKNMDAH
jgi:hypothetical protein